MQTEEDLIEQLRQEAAAATGKYERLQQITDALPVLIAYIDAAGCYQFSNATYEHWLGFTPAQLQGKHVADGLAPDAAALVRKHMQTVLVTGNAVEYQSTIDHRHRGKILVLIQYTPHRLPSGEVVGIFSLISDNSDRLDPERAAALTSALAAASSEAIYSCAPNGEVVSWNKAAELMFGFSAEQILGTSMRQLVPAGLQEEAERLFKIASGGEAVHRYDTKRLHKSGIELEVMISMLPVQRGDQVTAVAVTTTDKSLQKTAEKKRQEYMAEIERKNAEIEQFVYTVSHDLKTPLVTIQSFLGFLEEDLSSEDWDGARDAMGRIQSASRRMRELIDDILIISRLGRQQLNCQLVDVEEIVNLVLEELATEAQVGDDIKLVTPIPEVVADPGHLKQVFSNLLKNSFRHGRKSGQPLEVRIGYKGVDHEHQFYVQDAGPGIALENQRRIFHLFQKLSPPNSIGTGAGLAIVEKLVELHRGRVWVESALMQGATFWFALPSDLPIVDGTV